MVRRFDTYSCTCYRNSDKWDAWAQICLDSILKVIKDSLELWRPKYIVTWEAITSRKNMGFGVKEVCQHKLSSATTSIHFLSLYFLILYLEVCVCALSCAWLFVTPWPLVHQAFLSMEFSKQEYWSELPFSSPGSSRMKEGTHLTRMSCISRWILYQLSHKGSPCI